MSSSSLSTPGPSLKISASAQMENSLTFFSPSGDGMRFAVGDVVAAEVLSASPDGSVSIRLATETGRNGVVNARSEVPLTAGETILLKVVGGEREVALRFLGVVRGDGMPDGAPAGLPEAYRELASELAASRMSAAEVREALASLRSLSELVKEAVPGWETVGKPPGMEGLDGTALKGAVEETGILLETKLKLVADGAAAAKGADAAVLQGAKAILSGMDRKEALLRLAGALRDREVAQSVRSAGGSPGDAALKADGLLSTIESYQLSSAAHGALYAPLPLDWDELVDGELLFRRRGSGKEGSYTCAIHLDLRPLGKMSVSVTMYGGAFYVSLAPEDEGARSLMASRTAEIERRFLDVGLPLKSVSVVRKGGVEFGVPPRDGVDVEA